MQIPQDRKYTLTTASGTDQETITNLKNSRLTKIYISPTTATTTYDFYILDKNSLKTYSIETYEGNFLDNEVIEYIYGNFTIVLENASKDEAFTVLLVFVDDV